MSCPELQLGFVLKVEDNIFCLALFVEPGILLIANYSRFVVLGNIEAPKIVCPAPVISPTIAIVLSFSPFDSSTAFNVFVGLSCALSQTVAANDQGFVQVEINHRS